MTDIKYKKTILLLAGYPGTGKTYMADMLMKKFPGFTMLSPDKIKEEYWDTYGFDNLKEKEQLIALSWQEFYRRMEKSFQEGRLLISDYPFSEKQRTSIQKLCNKYGYQVITIRLVGDLDVLFQRQNKRDLDNSRHLGHILLQYQRDNQDIPHEEADNLLDYEEFMKRCSERGYGDFALGFTKEMDMTEFDKVDYAGAFKEIEAMLR